MNRSWMLFTFAIVLFSAGCTDLGTAPTDEYTNYTGTVIDDGGGGYFIQTDLLIGSTNIVYPTNLPPAFQKNGLRVVFNARDDARQFIDYIHPPVRLSSIRLIDQYFYVPASGPPANYPGRWPEA